MTKKEAEIRMEELKRLKRRIVLYIGGFILIPYPLLILSGMIAKRYPQLYYHTSAILLVFIALLIMFNVLIIRQIFKYRKVKRTL